MVFAQVETSSDDPTLEVSNSSKDEEQIRAQGPQEKRLPPSRSSSPAPTVESSESTLAGGPSEAVVAAKANLKVQLKKHNRSAKHPDVVKAIEELQALNQTEDAAFSPHLEGDFVSLTKPEFPGRIKQEPENDHLDQYTLGRMSFGIFQPRNLVCTMLGTKNTLKRSQDDEQKTSDDSRTFMYPLITEIMVHTDKGDFPAALRMEAFISNHKQPKNRLGVTFVGGTMCPAQSVRDDSTKLALWKEVFAGAYTKADAERSYLSSLMLYVFKWMFKLTTPTDEDAAMSSESAVSFEMRRCPHGYVDIIYLDEDMRITRGNRGTIVIVERAPNKN
jgi:hypothetical protein